MFGLFYSLYYAMFVGSWFRFPANEIFSYNLNSVKELGTFLTSIFGDAQMTDFGTYLFTPIQTANVYFIPFLGICSLILATITSIGIVVMAVKGVKKAFGIFFMGIR